MVTLFAFLAGILTSLVGVFAYTRFSKSQPSESVRYFPGIRSEISPFSAEEIGTLILEFYKAWIDHSNWMGASKYNDQVMYVLNDLRITWSEKMLEASGEEKITGETLTPYHIKVWRGVKLNGSYKITRTALVYQLLHVVLWNLYGDPYYGKITGTSYSEWVKTFDPVIKQTLEQTRRKGF